MLKLPRMRCHGVCYHREWYSWMMYHGVCLYVNDISCISKTWYSNLVVSSPSIFNIICYFLYFRNLYYFCCGTVLLLSAIFIIIYFYSCTSIIIYYFLLNQEFIKTRLNSKQHKVLLHMYSHAWLTTFFSISCCIFYLCGQKFTKWNVICYESTTSLSWL